jgi:hypothetical protein
MIASQQPMNLIPADSGQYIYERVPSKEFGLVKSDFFLIRVLQTSSSSIIILGNAGRGLISLETPTAGLKKPRYTQLLGVMIGVLLGLLGLFSRQNSYIHFKTSNVHLPDFDRAYACDRQHMASTNTSVLCAV